MLIDTDNNQENMSEIQDREVRDELMREFDTSLTRQMILLQFPPVDPIDEISKFLTGYFNYPVNDDLESREIYISPVMQSDPTNREDLTEVCNVINSVFDRSWGIKFLQDIDIHYLYCLYKVLYINFTNYLIYFFNGLQTLDESFVEDFPNYNEYTFNYYIHNIYPNKHHIEKLNDDQTIKYEVIKEYINYVLSLGIKSELFFEICLNEAEGDVALSTLYIESENNNIAYDDEFFNLKMKKLMNLPESDIIVSRLTDFI